MIRATVFFLFLITSTTVASQRTFNLELIVKNDKKESISKADARILNKNLIAIRKNDRLTFHDLIQGTYQVYVTAENYSSKLLNIEVGENLTREVVLQQEFKDLGDIIITSDKKEITLTGAPSSSTVFTSKQIKDLRIWKLNDLSGLAPNLYLGHSGDNRNVTGMRGVVTTSYEQAVATYIDGVAQFGLDTYIPQLNDIESIEVIRGVQSTYYGRNAMGGVINIITKQPQDHVASHLDLQFGGYDQRRISAGIKTPLMNKKLFASASFLHDSRKGFYTNDVTKKDYDGQRQNMFNLQLKHLLSKGWSIQADHKQYTARNKGAFPLVNDLDALFKNPYQLSQNQIATMHDRTSNTSLVLKHEGDKLDMVLQSALQHNYRYYDNTLDADFSPFEIVGIFNNYGEEYNKVSVLTHEFRIRSKKSKTSKLEWNAGAFQYQQNSPTRQATVFGKDAGFIGIPDKNFALISTNIARNSGIAAYGDLKMVLEDRLILNAGLRLDNEWRYLSVRGEYEKQPNLAFVTRPDTAARTSYAALSPRLTMQYLASSSNTVYVNISRGFRAGGLSAITSDPSQLPLWSFKPEYSNMLEMGFKGQNESKTFRYNVVLFYNRINNIQSPRLLLPDAVTVTQNAGKLNATGIETEITYKPAKGLTIHNAMGFTDATFGSLKGISNGSEIDLSGKRQIFTPRSTNFTSVQYETKLGKSTLMFRTEYNRIGDQYFDLQNKIKQKAYGLLNFRCGISISQIEFFVWGRNLTGKKYIAYAYDFGAAHLGEPRMIGVGLSWKR